MVWEPKQCCCGASVRVGTLVIGWLTLIGTALHLMSTLRYAALSHDDFVKLCEMVFNSTDSPKSEYIDPADCPTFASVVIACVAISGVLCAFAVIISIMLLVGVNKNKHMFMVPYLVVRAIEITILIALGVFMMIFMIYLGTFLGAFIMAITFGLVTFLDVYFFLVVRACYKEVKALSGGSDVPYVQHQDVPYAQHQDMSYKI